MDRELMSKRPANMTLVMPRPVGTVTIRRKTQKATLRELRRLTRRGYVHSASNLAQFHQKAGGGYGVKVYLAKPLPEPMPAWAKGAALVGTVLTVLSGVTVLVLHALASMFTALALLPWALIMGGGVAIVVAVSLARRLLGGGITVNQNVNIR